MAEGATGDWPSRRLTSRLSDKSWLPLGLCILLAAPATWWLTQVDFFASHDGDLHRWRIWEFWQIWQSGQVPVRWSADLGYGFGSPLFTYYNPLAYLLGGAMQGWGLSAVDAAKLVYGASLVLVMVGMYVLAVEWYRGQPARRWAALVAATACLYAPYLLANVYQRGAMAEALALGIAPWVLWAGLRSLRRRDLANHLALALSVGMLVLTHSLTALTFGSLAAVLALVWLAANKVELPAGIHAVGKLLLAVTLGLAISGFYLIPAIGQLGYVQIHQAQRSAAGSKYLEHFIPATEVMQTLPIHDYGLDYTSAMPSVPHLGLVQTVVIVTGLVVGGLMGHWRRPTELLLTVGIAGALFMVSPASRVVWDVAPGLATFQFPWRFLGIVAILGGLIAGRLAAFRTYGAPIALALSIAVIVAGMWVQVVPREWPTYRGPPADAGEFERRTGKYALTSDDEFLPTWVKRVRFTLFDSIRVGGTSGAAIGEVKLVEAQQSHWQFEITTAEPTTMTLDMFYFPNWRATIDGKPAETRAVSDLGLLGIDVPAGSHGIEVFQEATALERIGLVVSVLALLLLGGLWIWRRGGVRANWMLIGMIAVVVVALLPLILAAVRPRPLPEYRPAPQGTVQDGGVQLLGARLDQTRLASSGIVDVALSFVSAGDPPDEAPVLRARLVDSGERVVAGSTHVLGRGLRPTAIWLPNMVLTDRFELELPFGSAGGDYVLKVGFVDSPMSSVGSFNLEASGAKQIFIPEAATSDGWKPVLWGERLVLDRVKIRQEVWGGSDQGQGIRLLGTFWWRSVGDGSGIYEAVIRLIDGQGEIQKETIDTIDFSSGETLVNQDTALPLPADLPPGRYRIELLVSDGAGEMLSISSEEDIASPATSVVLWAHYVPGDPTVVDLDMDDGLRMLGYDREMDGETVDVTVYWQAGEKVKRQYTSFIHLLDREGRLVDQHDAVAYYGGMPTTRWEVGRAVPFAAKLRLPESGGPFRLRSGMYEFNSRVRLATADGRAYISLGLLEGRERPEGPAVEFAGGVRLLGYRLERENDQGVVTLYWQTSRRVGHNYSVFVHVLDSENNIVAQGDGPPEMGERTSAEWPVGEVIVDPHWFEMPAERPLRVRIGLYRLDDGSRLATTSGDDKVDLGEMD